MHRDFPKKPHKTPSESPWLKVIHRHSPYLSLCLGKNHLNPENAPEIQFDKILDDAAKNIGHDTQDLMKSLRQAKRKIAVLTAACDVSGVWDDMTVTRMLSRFADFCTQQALQHLLLEAYAEKRIRLTSPKNPAKDCGVAVIALGKWGAHELNYSSDIDLMVVFDPARAPVKNKDDIQNFYIRLTRDLARLLDQPTEDGYVFRTDLRLRPDPGAMPLAISIVTAEVYYGSLGQNWERAAMIKARPVAGDDAVGQEFMKIMNAWIWRKNLDFAAIQDIHSIKRQINARQKTSRKGMNPWMGFNVKLGHGGIREIEFFAQTQQLIYGGRDMSLRTPATLQALDALAASGHITEKARQSLHDAYLFLRHTEHRLQMVDDRQTHSLPEQEKDFDSIALFAGYTDRKAFIKDLTKHTSNVRKLYGALFTESASLSSPGNLVFTGVEDDPETLVTLRDMGFSHPEKITSAIRGWHHGRYRAVRSERARQILTELVPHLLSVFAQTPHPDDAFIRFDTFLSRLPSGVPIFSMFLQKPDVMTLTADVMGTSPVLAEYLGSHPNVLDGVLSRDFFGRLPDLSRLTDDLQRVLLPARDYQDVLDIVRRWTREKRFHAGIHILRNLSAHDVAARYLSDIAEAALTCLIPHVENDFAQTHGRFETGGLMVLSMGSFAARNMYWDSDLDLIGLYDMPYEEKSSNGAKPLPPSAYYIRLMQRVVTAVTVPTSEGSLFDIDTRLRPAGLDGPLAVSLDSFFEYQNKQAWTWEHMSLIRSRLIYAPADAARNFERRKKDVRCAPRDIARLSRDMKDMRAKIVASFGDKNIWDVKYAKGGIMDIMFALHFLMLSHAATHKNIIKARLMESLDALRSQKIIGAKDHETLKNTLALAERIMAYLRLSAEQPFRPEKTKNSVKDALARHILSAKQGKNFASLKQILAEQLKKSAAVCEKIRKIKS